MRLFALLAALSLLAGNATAQTVPVFVQTEWLAQHLGDPDLIVLHVGFNRGDYRLEHIPGARFLWYEWLTVSTPDASTEMASVQQADSVLESLGVAEDSRIVIYFTGSNITTTTRTYLALSYFGFGPRTSILDGGLEQWKREGRPVTAAVPTAKRTSLSLVTLPRVIVDAQWIREHLGDSDYAIVDSRDRRFFEGNGGGSRRTGHIKGAVSIPYSTCVDSLTRMKDDEALGTLLEQAGIRKGQKVVTYCHVGQQATLTFAALRHLGFDVAVYDGSFQDWNIRGDDYPVEKTGP